MKKRMVCVHYLKDRLKFMLVFIVAVLIFAVVFILYQIPLDAVGYASLISLFFGLIVIFSDFRRYLEKHKKLTFKLKEIRYNIENMPDPANIFEEDYQNLINEINSDKLKIISDNDKRIQNMMDYYSMWVHQIKIPISAMRLLLQQEEETELIRELKMELFRIEQYVEMVLVYLRLGSDFTDYVIKKCNMDKLLRQAIRKYAPMFIRKKIALDYRSCEGVTVLTDEKWLLFVIEQLLSNAIKYTDKGKISIYMEDTKLIIEDTGIGINESDLPRIFEKGYTGYNGRKEEKSTGIGLYLCKKITDNLKNTLVIESSPGKGTKVILDLMKDRIVVE